MNTTPLTVSAPGKLLLFGDHAVVYGYPSITTAINERLFVTIVETGDGTISIDAVQVNDTRFVDAAVQATINDWGIQHNGFRLTTKSIFTGKYGFGSSSAVTVATLKAIVSLYHKDVDLKTIFKKAYAIVLSIQGVGSGFDVAAATYGETMYYVKGGNILEPMKIGNMPLVVGYTGVKSNTVDMVKMVAEKREKYPEKVERIFQGIGKLVDQAKEKILSGDWERVGRLMDFNQEYLRDLGVSSDELEALISAAKGAGAWGAKLSGSGGGDCMIALAPADTRQLVEEAITKAGGEVVRVAPNAEGVRVEP